MQACYGLFVFSMTTAPIKGINRQRVWRYARPNVLDTRAKGIFLGPGEDTITITGQISHDIAGHELSLDALALMGDEGKAWPLVKGTGQILGSFQLESIDETHRDLFPNGSPRAIDFSMSLTRVDDAITDALALVSAPLSLL